MTLPPNVSILISRQPINMQKSFDGLIAIVRSVLHVDPANGALFVFFNKKRNKIKILYWDHDGFALWYKRLETGTFRLPKITKNAMSVPVTRAQLGMLLEGIELNNAKQYKRYSKKVA